MYSRLQKRKRRILGKDLSHLLPYSLQHFSFARQFVLCYTHTASHSEKNSGTFFLESNPWNCYQSEYQAMTRMKYELSKHRFQVAKCRASSKVNHFATQIHNPRTNFTVFVGSYWKLKWREKLTECYTRSPYILVGYSHLSRCCFVGKHILARHKAVLQNTVATQLEVLFIVRSSKSVTSSSRPLQGCHLKKACRKTNATILLTANEHIYWSIILQFRWFSEPKMEQVQCTAIQLVNFYVNTQIFLQ